MAPLSPVGIGRRPNLWCSEWRRPHEHLEVCHEYDLSGQRRRRRGAGMKPLLTPAELEALDCQMRSGIAPDLETARRLLRDLLDLREAQRWEARRLEYAR